MTSTFREHDFRVEKIAAPLRHGVTESIRYGIALGRFKSGEPDRWIVIGVTYRLRPGGAPTVKYDELARASGYQRTYAFTSLEEFTGAIGDIMSQPGPVFVAMKVLPEIINEAIGRRPRWQTRSRTQVIEDLQKELGVAG